VNEIVTNNSETKALLSSIIETKERMHALDTGRWKRNHE
jgi:hypothetical protein